MKHRLNSNYLWENADNSILASRRDNALSNSNGQLILLKNTLLKTVLELLSLDTIYVAELSN